MFQKEYYKKMGRLDLVKEIDKKYYEANREKILAKKKDHYIRNREKLLAAAKRRAEVKKDLAQLLGVEYVK